LTGPKAGNRRLVIKTIAAYNINRALEHEPDRGIALRDVIDDLTGCEVARWPVCKALRHVDLARVEHRKQLVATSLDDTQCALLSAAF